MIIDNSIYQREQYNYQQLITKARGRYADWSVK